MYTLLPLVKPVPILKVLSIVPLVFNLIIRLLVTPLYDVKSPPTNILLSGCGTIVYTLLPLVKPVPILNVLSIVPPVFNLIILSPTGKISLFNISKALNFCGYSGLTFSPKLKRNCVVPPVI